MKSKSNYENIEAVFIILLIVASTLIYLNIKKMNDNEIFIKNKKQ